MENVLTGLVVIATIIATLVLLCFPIHLALKTLFKDREDVGITYRMSIYFLVLYFLYYLLVSIGLGVLGLIIALPLSLLF